MNSEQFTEFFNEDNSLDILKAFYNGLENSSFGYIYMFNQSINIIDFKGDTKFYTWYEDGASYNTEPHKIPIKTLQINEQAYNFYGLSKKVIGSSLKKDNFIYNKYDAIPIILGHDYKSYYSIGDTFWGYHIANRFKFEVIGFLKENSKILYRPNQPELYLDRYIIMPALRFMDYTEKNNYSLHLFQKRHYFQLINGVVVSNSNEYFIKDKINELSIRTDFPMPAIYKVDKKYTESIIDFLNYYRANIVAFSVLLFMTITITITYSIKSSVKKSMTDICVHVISGSSINNIRKALLFRIITPLYIAQFLSLAFQIIIFKKIYINYIMLILSFSFMLHLISWLIIVNSLKLKNITLVLKNRG